MVRPPFSVSPPLLVSQEVRGHNAKVEKNFFLFLLSNCFVNSGGMETEIRNVSWGYSEPAWLQEQRASL